MQGPSSKMADVARLAGVSVATVSRVLNGYPFVAESTKKKVRSAVKELSYRPNLVASALSTKKTRTFGLLVPSVRNPFFAELAHAIEAEAAKIDYSVVICNTDDQPQKVEKHLALLRQKGVDGLIIAPSPGSDASVQPILDFGSPVNVVAADLPALPLSCIHVDDFHAAYEATRHLLNLGHTRLALVAEYLDLPSSTDRINGYRLAIEQRGARGADNVIEAAGRFISDGMEATEPILNLDPRPTAVFCASDMIAIGFIHGLRQLGLEVPDDMSVVGFGGTILAGVIYPPLTTVVQPIGEIAKASVDAVAAAVEGVQKPVQRVAIKSTLQIGKSTAPWRP